MQLRKLRLLRGTQFLQPVLGTGRAKREAGKETGKKTRNKEKRQAQAK